MSKIKSRVNIAAVILSFADKPLHSNSDLSYMAEVIRAGEDKNPDTPWATMYSNLTTKIKSHGWFISEPDSCFSLNVPPGMDKKDFAIEKVTQPVYDSICEELRKNHFLTADNHLQWVPRKDYSYDPSAPPH